MQVLRTSATGVAAPFRRVQGLPQLRQLSGARQIGSRNMRMMAEDPAKAAAAALDSAAEKAKEVAAAGAVAAKDAATSAVSKAKAAINQATLDVDIKQLLTYNFLVQVGLTAVSWAVVFLTSHITWAKGAGVNPTTVVLLVGVALAGYSAYLSFTYLSKTKKEGLGALDGWSQLNAFYDHATINFIGAAATIVALMAQVGTLMMKSTGSLAIEALAQAASNTLLAHLVSLAFLMVMTRKITQAYQKIADWSAQLDALKASMPTLK